MKSIVKEPKVIHYSISEILKDYTIPDAYDIWAWKLERFYSTNTYRSLNVTDTYIRSILLRSARKTIYESLLTNKHKEEEIDNLNEYGMY